MNLLRALLMLVVPLLISFPLCADADMHAPDDGQRPDAAEQLPPRVDAAAGVIPVAPAEVDIDEGGSEEVIPPSVGDDDQPEFALDDNFDNDALRAVAMSLLAGEKKKPKNLKIA